MKTTVTLEFDSHEAAEQFLASVREGEPTLPGKAPRADRGVRRGPYKPRAERPAEPVMQANVVGHPVAPTPEPLTVIAAPDEAPAAPKVSPAAPEVAPAAPADQRTPKELLREIYNTKGAEAATNLLREFGAARISDITPDKAAAFVEAAAKVLA